MHLLKHKLRLILSTLLMLLVFFPQLSIAETSKPNTTISHKADKQLSKININTASAEELSAKLKGIGNKRALDIIAYREKHGPFLSIEQLLEIKGIGQSILTQNQDILVLQ